LVTHPKPNLLWIRGSEFPREREGTGPLRGGLRRKAPLEVFATYSRAHNSYTIPIPRAKVLLSPSRMGRGGNPPVIIRWGGE